MYGLFQKTCNSDAGLGCPANNISFFQARHKHPELLIRILPQCHPHVCIQAHRHAARSITYVAHFILTVASPAKSYTVFINGGTWEMCLHPHALHLYICGVIALSALLPCETPVCSAAGLQTPQSRRPRIASLPPIANRTVTNQFPASSPARHKITPLSCHRPQVLASHTHWHLISPVPPQNNLLPSHKTNLLQSKHTTIQAYYHGCNNLQSTGTHKY